MSTKKLYPRVAKVEVALLLALSAASSFANSYSFRIAAPGLLPENQPQAPAGPFALNINTNGTSTLDIRTAALAAGWDGQAAVVATVATGVMRGAPSTSGYALTIQGSFPGGVTLVNNGTISGAGGAGATQKAIAGAGYAGGAGGPAIQATVSVTVQNLGIIAGGGGGGGSGGSYYGSETWPYGGAGGGGQGYPGGAAGGTSDGNYYASAGTTSKGGNGARSAAGNAGGAGGSAGISGSIGANTYLEPGGGGGGGGWGASGGAGGAYSYAGGTGGAAGAYIAGNRFVTWTKTGTHYGAALN